MERIELSITLQRMKKYKFITANIVYLVYYSSIFNDCIKEYKEAMKQGEDYWKSGYTLRCTGEGEVKHTYCHLQSRAKSRPIEHSLSPKDLFGEMEIAINIIGYQHKI